jgi:hypothetical protein
MEALWKKQYSLTALTAADQFKSYEDLDKRLKYVLGQKGSAKSQVIDEDDEYESYTQTPSKEDRVMQELEESYKRSKSAPPVPEDLRTELNNLSSSSSSDDDEDDTLSYFQKLAES